MEEKTVACKTLETIAQAPQSRLAEVEVFRKSVDGREKWKQKDTEGLQKSAGNRCER